MARRKPSANIDIPRLCQDIKRARLTLRRCRENRREMVKQFVGENYSEDGSIKEVPLNLISLYVSVIGKNLIAKDPRVMLSTFVRQQKPIVAAMESWANKEIVHVRLAEILQRIVTDALFSVGICKIALASPADAASYSWNLRAGEPTAMRVDLDDFVYDVHARDFSEVSYIGHRFRVPLDSVKDSKFYSKARRSLEANYDQFYNQEGDERVSVIGRGYYQAQAEEWEDHVDLWELYLPRHRIVLTLSDADVVTGGSDAEPLKDQTWLGPDQGPYRILGFQVVPGNALFKGPLQDLFCLHNEANRTFRKIIRSTERMKEVMLVRTGNLETAERIRNAIDGEIVPVDDPESYQQVVMNGQHVPALVQIGTLFKDLFSYLGGNLELLGGRGPQSKTATQDEMLNQNASVGIADMQDRTVRFASDVLRSLLWYWHHDPFKTMNVEHSLKSVPQMQMVRRITPQMRRMGRFEDIDIKIDPYSMQHQTPQARMAALDQVMTQVIVPMAPILQQQNIVPDMNKYLEKKAKYMDMPDLAEIITMQEQQPQPVQAAPTGAAQPRMPGNTNRQYTRRNVPQEAQPGNEQHVVNALMGVATGGAQRRPQGLIPK